MGRKRVSLILFLLAGCALLSILSIPLSKQIVLFVLRNTPISQNLLRLHGRSYRCGFVWSNVHKCCFCCCYFTHRRTIPNNSQKLSYRYKLNNGTHWLNIGPIYCWWSRVNNLVYSDHYLWNLFDNCWAFSCRATRNGTQWTKWYNWRGNDKRD